MTQRHPYAGHPAALVLADHQPKYVTAVTQSGARVRCCCDGWDGQWCDFGAHQAEVLAEAGQVEERKSCGCGSSCRWLRGAGGDEDDVSDSATRATPPASFMERMAKATGIFDRSTIVVSCGKCGATADLDSTRRDGLPRGWERFIIRDERRYACPACIDQAGLPKEDT